MDGAHVSLAETKPSMATWRSDYFCSCSLQGHDFQSLHPCWTSSHHFSEDYSEETRYNLTPGAEGKKMWDPRGGLEWLSEAEGDRRAGTKGGALFPWRRADMCECILFKRSTPALLSTQDPYVSTHLHFPRHSRFVMLSWEPFLIVVKSSFFMGGRGCEGSVIHFYKIALKFLQERC